MKPRFVTSAITLLVLVVILGGAGYWGWQHTTAPMPGLGLGSACQTKTVDITLKTSQVQVSVYNAGRKSGLANDVMKKLAKRKFIRGDVANPPSDAPTPTPAEPKVKKVMVRTSTPDSAMARLVALQFGVEPTVTSVNWGPGVDVVVGSKFDPKKDFAKPTAELTYTVDKKVCSASPS